MSKVKLHMSTSDTHTSSTQFSLYLSLYFFWHPKAVCRIWLSRGQTFKFCQYAESFGTHNWATRDTPNVQSVESLGKWNWQPTKWREPATSNACSGAFFTSFTHQPSGISESESLWCQLTHRQNAFKHRSKALYWAGLSHPTFSAFATIVWTTPVPKWSTLGLETSHTLPKPVKYARSWFHRY